MLKKINSKKHNLIYLITIVAILLLSLIFIVISNSTNMPGKQILEESKQYSKEISKALYEIEEHLNQYGGIFGILIENHAMENERLLFDEQKMKVLSEQMNTVLLQYTDEQNIAEGYFFNLNAAIPSTEYELYYNEKNGKTAHITKLMSTADVQNLNNTFNAKNEPLWNTNYNAFSDTVNLQYLIPLYENDEYIGFVGIIVDIDKLRDLIDIETEGREFLLLTKSKEVLIHPYYMPGESLSALYNGNLAKAFDDSKTENSVMIRDYFGRFMIYAYQTLPSGQIFFTVQDLFKMMSKVNLLAICAAIVAILIIMIAHKKDGTDKSVFDNLAERIIAVKGARILSEDDENRMKAVIAMELGICVMLSAFGVYQLIFTGNVIEFVMYITGSICIHYITYQFILGKLTETIKFLFICLMFLAVVGFHVMKGGFGESGNGAAISWMLGILIFGCFLVKSEWMNYVFGVYVIFLSLDIMAELYFLQNSHYERMLVFVTSLLYAGFALHTAISIYVKESIADGKRIKNLLKEVRETQSFLIQQEKMAALGQLISGVAHEINTPVGAIKGAAQTMETGLIPMLRLLKRCKEEFDEEDYECFFEIIMLAADGIKEMKSTMEIRQGKRELKKYLDDINLLERDEILEMLVRLEITDINKLKEQKAILGNQYLSDILGIAVNLSGFIVGIQTILFATSRVSRIVFALKSYAYTSVSNEMVSMDLIKNIENILILYHNQIKQNVEVIKEYDEDIQNITGKPDELAQVWTNLIQNALYAMKEGGVLTIRIKHLDDKWIEVTIEDTGTGIEEAILERIYEPFFTTKPLGEGSGLGLDISKKVIKAHNGTIHIESRLMEGTRFIIKLPKRHNEELEMKETMQ